MSRDQDTGGEDGVDDFLHAQIFRQGSILLISSVR